jgi:hypothetical protein
MIVNPKILTILEENEISRDDGITYLIALYNNLNPSYIPEELKRKIYANGIINRGDSKGTITWIVPLFKDDDSNNWEWVTTKFRTMFSQLRGDGGGNKKSCIEKMQLFFKNNPNTKIEDVLSSAAMYLEQFKNGKQNVQYMQRADYFILKTQRGAGGITHESRLEEYLEIVKKQKEKAELQTKYIMK